MITPKLSNKIINKIKTIVHFEPSDRIFLPIIINPLNLEHFLKFFRNRIIAFIPNYIFVSKILKSPFLAEAILRNHIEIRIDFFGLYHKLDQQDFTKIIIIFPENLALSLLRFALQQMVNFSAQAPDLLIIISNKKQEVVLINWLKRNEITFSKKKFKEKFFYFLPEFHASKIDKVSFEDFTFKITYRKEFGEFEFFSSDGIFSKDKVDNGTDFLIDTILNKDLISNNSVIVDYFAGIGVIGITLSKLYIFSKLHFIESDLLSLYSLRKNLDFYQIKNVIIHEMDGLEKSSITPGTVDFIIANPPTHIKKEEFKIFLEMSKSLLKNGGKLIIVINQIIPYEDTLKEYFPNPTNLIMYHKDNYKIIVNY